ncbi:MAG: Fe3+-siderophores ABC transporter protein [Proteobacteria bacterium]|nr:MAG: Fe3+-siderophores ABC transporter protein [Pseudomonadota bacterium]
MRVVSLVPSWTETLIACGVNVVGRTRFCVHPAEAVAGIPVVGGTKDLKRAELEALAPDLVILDKEENLAFMADANAPWRTVVTHVESADDVPRELSALAFLLRNQILSELAREWKEVLSHPRYPDQKVKDLPGVLSWIRRPIAEPKTLLYLIWRSPWMAISRDTFIGSVLCHFGVGGRIPAFAEKYPKLDLGTYDPATTLLLFSSEPYPFEPKSLELAALGFPAAIVDGEAYSWFGIRALRFLQQSSSVIASED